MLSHEYHGKVHSKICCTLVSSCILLCTVSLSLCASGNLHACMRVLQYWLSYIHKYNEGFMCCTVFFSHKHNARSLLSCFWALYVHPVCVCIYVCICVSVCALHSVCVHLWKLSCKKAVKCYDARSFFPAVSRPLWVQYWSWGKLLTPQSLWVTFEFVTPDDFARVINQLYAIDTYTLYYVRIHYTG